MFDEIRHFRTSNIEHLTLKRFRPEPAACTSPHHAFKWGNALEIFDTLDVKADVDKLNGLLI